MGLFIKVFIRFSYFNLYFQMTSRVTRMIFILVGRDDPAMNVISEIFQMSPFARIFMKKSTLGGFAHKKVP